MSDMRAQGELAAPTANVTHVSDWSLAHCARVLIRPGQSRHPKHIKKRMLRRGLHADTVACDRTHASGRYGTDVVGVLRSETEIPTCPLCAVLRDEALEGRLPKPPTA